MTPEPALAGIPELLPCRRIEGEGGTYADKLTTDGRTLSARDTSASSRSAKRFDSVESA